MEALLVVDAQNEFSRDGLRPVPNHSEALEVIRERVRQARERRRPIAWVQHNYKANESRAFVPGSWGGALSPGLAPERGFGRERLFVKDVFGAFTGTGLEEWLLSHQVLDVILVGFYAHICLSTPAREALVRGFGVTIDPDGTGACDLDDPIAGRQTAADVQRSALLHLTHMGVRLARSQAPVAGAMQAAVG